MLETVRDSGMPELLIFLGGVILGKLEIDKHSRFKRTLVLFIFAFSTFFPLELMLGQNLEHFLGFGWGPDRTALGTITLVLGTRGGYLKGIILLPALIWSVIAALMYYGLQ
jgi:hypothetical protein